MSDKKLIARHLYLVEGKTQKQIAAEVGLSERTIHTWVHQYAWNKLKSAAFQAPAVISNNLFSQLAEIQNNIAARETGKRYPTVEEAEITRKLVSSINYMKKAPSLSTNMQMMESFREFCRPLNKQFSLQLAHYANRFLEAKGQNGFTPYDIESGVHQTPEVAPFYDELEGDQPCETINADPYYDICESRLTCLHPGNCSFPDCKRLKPTIDDPKENREPDTPWAPVPFKAPAN